MPLQGITPAGIPEEIAGLYTEISNAFLTGKLSTDFQKSGSPVNGNTKLEDFAKEFAAKL
ncbi:hypothetical protein [Pedobacter polysacchareus]|uniref:hypothetical protein n=1 Tax=Pedobacter polysacchareus TaxID=2861973 RepID=UPI001C99D1B5|nr:hypothetical protein [Pedobacter polysacchareus]